MVGWYHWLKGHEFEQTPRNGEGQGSLAYCSPWGHKESKATQPLNNSNNGTFQMWSKLACMPGRSAPKSLAWSCGSGLKGFITRGTAPSVYAAANGSFSSCQLLRLLSFLFFTFKTKTKMENQKKKGWLFLMNFLQWCLSFWFFYFLSAKRKGDTWICENNVQKS